MAVSKPTRRAPSAPARSAPARSAPSAPVRRTPAAPVRRTPSAPTPRAPMTAQEQRNLDSINARRAAREGGNTVNNSNVAFPVNPPANPQQTNADAFGE